MVTTDQWTVIPEKAERKTEQTETSKNWNKYRALAKI